MKIEKTEVIHSINVGISAILKGLFFMLAIWLGVWLLNVKLVDITSWFCHIFGGAIVGAAWYRLMSILVREL